MKPKIKAVLIVNLGSPSKLSISAIWRFLTAFLLDKRVVNLPKIMWAPLLLFIILPLRVTKLLHLYKNIWLKNGKSPLIYYTEEAARILQQELPDRVIAVNAFSYTKPLVKDVLINLHDKYILEELKVIPLYPQFSSTTTSVVFDHVHKFYKDKNYLPKLNFVRDFHDNEIYIELVANIIKKYWETHGKNAKLIISFHSLPLKNIILGDTYQEECYITAKLIAAKLNLNLDEYIVAFQSKFGRQKWLTPSILDILMDASKNNMSVDVVCPGFMCDCLETLEEIAIRNKEFFIENGGDKYNYIPCPNADKNIIKLFQSL